MLALVRYLMGLFPRIYGISNTLFPGIEATLRLALFEAHESYPVALLTLTFQFVQPIHVQVLPRAPTAILRLMVVLMKVCGFSLERARIPDRVGKAALLRAVDRSRSVLPLRVALGVLQLSPSRYHAWKGEISASSPICHRVPGQTPDEMYFGTGSQVYEDLAKAREAARQRRMEANRAVRCESCRPILALAH